MIEKLYNDEKVPGFRNRSDDSEMLKKFILEQTTENGLTYYVTHDSIVAMFKYHLFGIKHSKQDWIHFLDELIIEL